MEIFSKNITSIYGNTGKGWLADLPNFLKEIEKPFQNLTYHYAAIAIQSDGSEAIVNDSCVTAARTVIFSMKKNRDDESNNLDIKTKEYQVAIEKYNTIAWYSRVEIFSSILVVTLQIATIVMLFQQYNASSIVAVIITVFIAYIATDFINGVVHMIADNSTHYTSIIGPFIAAFKLHHSKLMYQSKHPIKLYFYESGHKLWLVFYLLIVFIVQCCVNLNFCLNLFLVIIGTLSSVAELSHFWCHNSKEGNTVIRLLQKYRIFLSMKHHRIHHASDNINYAFLNGMTDPFLNVIANIFYKGYKNRSDLHVNNH